MGKPGFIQRRGSHFTRDGRLHFFAGANFPQAMHLAMAEPPGDRLRLARELDTLRDIGVQNLRIMAASEGPDSEPFRLTPALLAEPGSYNPTVLDGLDYLVSEIARRGMHAVMCLGNFWHWSGGMAQYVSWATGDPIPYPSPDSADPDGFAAFARFASRFYSNNMARRRHADHVAEIVARVNPCTGRAYRDEPAVFSWELANEPRGVDSGPEMKAWIDKTAALIKSIDPNHMVATGSEGEAPGAGNDFIRDHSGPDIDYTTIHIWPQNWRWFDPAAPEKTLNSTLDKASIFFDTHAARAEDPLDKPLVVEEFGMPRDLGPRGDIHDPASPTSLRDAFYTFLLGKVHESAAGGGPAVGANFWAWSGQAKPGAGMVGDPPHERPGWYSVYASDESTTSAVAAFADEMRELSGGHGRVR